jgi:hypothetical protein
MFVVTILNRSNFSDQTDSDFEFSGDAEKLRHFVKEIQFVNEGHGDLAGSVVRGARDNLKATAKGLVDVVFHPVSTAEGLAGGFAEAVAYIKKCWNGDADFSKDAAEFVSMYADNTYMGEADAFGLNYMELMTPDSRAVITNRGHEKIAGMAATELLLVALPWAKASKAAEAAEVAKVTEGVSEAGSLTKLGRWAKFFSFASKAEDGAARTARFTEAASKMSNLDKLANLLSPPKIATLKTSRALNSRLHKVLYWLRQEEIGGHDVSEALTRSMKIARADERFPGTLLDPKLDHSQILENYETAKKLGVFEDQKNLELMRRGQSPWVNTPWGLDQIEIDHEVAVSWAPELENCWGNLTYQTKRANRLYSDKIKESALNKLGQYKNAGLLPEQRINEIIIRASKVTAAVP